MPVKVGAKIIFVAGIAVKILLPAGASNICTKRFVSVGITVWAVAVTVAVKDSSVPFLGIEKAKILVAEERLIWFPVIAVVVALPKPMVPTISGFPDVSVLIAIWPPLANGIIAPKPGLPGGPGKPLGPLGPGGPGGQNLCGQQDKLQKQEKSLL